jgi:hypothetical protein
VIEPIIDEISLEDPRAKDMPINIARKKTKTVMETAAATALEAETATATTIETDETNKIPIKMTKEKSNRPPKSVTN